MKILCLFGIHKYKRILLERMGDRGPIVETFKCKKCDKTKKHTYNPCRIYICEGCGKDVQDCLCNDC